MLHGNNDAKIIRKTHNTARFFTEQRHISWVLLVATLLWGVYGYLNMPKRKDPEFGRRYAVVICPWPGAGAEKVEQLVTRRIEEKVAQNSRIEKIESTSRTGVSVVTITMDDKRFENDKEFDDIQLRLDAIKDLPQGAGPLRFNKDFADTAALMLTVASPKLNGDDKYNYRELDQFTDLIARTLQGMPLVSRVTRMGVLDERIFLDYSQERLASTGLQPGLLGQILNARNITLPGGVLEVGDKNLVIDPSGEFKSEQEFGDVLVANSNAGAPIYLRDVLQISRGYETPARFLNFYTWRDERGHWQRSRAITIAVTMRSGEQIGRFGAAADAALDSLKGRLPDDLILARVSDQEQQVSENIGLFMRSLVEAALLVILVALIGFWHWRSAALVAAAIPVTLAMTFGMIHALGIDVQEVSVAALIISLGLLVDDPVVAGDAIKRELASGHSSEVAAWLGPTKLARAILYATVTNIVAYLPLLLISGSVGRFVYSLPIVIACSLVASRVVSMTFIPLFAFYLFQRGMTAERSLSERRERGFTAFYYRAGRFALDHRRMALLVSLAILVAGGLAATRLKLQFFPNDLSYLSYIDLWLHEDAPLATTNETASRAEAIIREVTAKYGAEHPGKDGRPREILASLTTFAGGGGPRFWFSVAPEQQQLNYAQIVIQVKDKRDTAHLIAPLQHALSASVAGARIDVRQLETGKPVGIPVSIRLSGDDLPGLRALAEQAKDIFRAIPEADRVRDDWGTESFRVNLLVNADRASLAGVSNLDVAASSAGGMSGLQLTSLREGDKQIPALVRLREAERARLSDVQNLYVYSMHNASKIPLRQVSTIDYRMETEKIRRRNQFRTITVSCSPVPGVLASQVMKAARERLDEFEKTLPLGYKMELGGEQEDRRKSFSELVGVIAVIVLAIFVALVIQFRHAFKPLLVFSAIPFGMVGAVIALAVMGAPFGFMAFLGMASLIGVIVSHIIILFDFVEDQREQGAALTEALLDAGIARLRPVMITVGATVFGLIPLAVNGGPLWESLCYAQIGGLIVANYITKLLVPALYAIFVLDLKIIRWEGN